MLSKIGLAILVAIGVTLGCILVGEILVNINVAVAITIGDFLRTYSAAVGLLSGLWYFFSRQTI